MNTTKYNVDAEAFLSEDENEREEGELPDGNF
jgi:hypothetical protein